MEQDLSQYNDKKVIVTHKAKDGADGVETEGTVQTGNELGLLIKPKGKTGLALINKDDIDDIKLVPSSAKALTRKTLKPVELGQARTHLAERHGYTLSQVNKMSEEEAFETHAGIDHEAADLGHVHGDKSANEKAIENAA